MEEMFILKLADLRAESDSPISPLTAQNTQMWHEEPFISHLLTNYHKIPNDAYTSEHVLHPGESQHILPSASLPPGTALCGTGLQLP